MPKTRSKDKFIRTKDIGQVAQVVADDLIARYGLAQGNAIAKLIKFKVGAVHKAMLRKYGRIDW